MNRKNTNQAGKGDTPRPVDFKKYQSNYEEIFGRKDKKKKTQGGGR